MGDDPSLNLEHTLSVIFCPDDQARLRAWAKEAGVDAWQLVQLAVIVNLDHRDKKAKHAVRKARSRG